MSGGNARGESSRLAALDRPISAASSRPSRSSATLGKGEDEQTAHEAMQPDSTTPLLRRNQSAQGQQRRAKRSTSFLCRFLLPLFLIAVLVSIFHAYLSWATSPSPPSTPSSDQATSLLPNATLSNGTHTFRRTVVLISLDGAKPSYLSSGHAPHLQSLGTSSATSRRASFMQAIFPTLTFPNHWALLTGLYAASHGIVANDFTLASTGEQFYYTSPEHSWNASWWRGEPIWATAERAGLNAAVLMWPGPPVTSAGIRATYFQKYASGPEWNLDGRLHQVLRWIDRDAVDERPSLVCAYVPDIDQAAHKFGPESEQAIAAVRSVDAFIGKLQKELVETRNLSEVVDIVVVSDHGMTSTSNSKLIFLDELLGPQLYRQIEHRDGWPSAGLRFKGQTEAQRADNARRAYDKLSNVPAERREGWKLYRRADLPERYHLASAAVEDRLAPLWMVPELGWSITTHPEMAGFTDGVYAPRGNHGYDNLEPDMHAIFVASGPSLTPAPPSAAKGRGWNMEGFQNVQVHNLVSRILGVPESKRANTNGTWSFWDPHLRAGL